MIPDRGETTRTYRTRTPYVIPLAVDAFLAFVLVTVVYFGNGTSMERLVLTVILVVLAGLLLDALCRRAVIGSDGIVITRFLRKKEITWNQITNVDAMVMRKKAYLLLTTTAGFHVISNNLSGFSTIVADILARLDDEKVDPTVRQALSGPMRRISDVVLLWVAAVIMIGIMLYKLSC